MLHYIFPLMALAYCTTRSSSKMAGINCEKEAEIVGSGDEDVVLSELLIIYVSIKWNVKNIYHSVSGSEHEPEHAESAAASSSTGVEAVSPVPLDTPKATSGLCHLCFVRASHWYSMILLQDVLHSLKLEHLGELFEREDVTMNVLMDLTSEDLQSG